MDSCEAAASIEEDRDEEAEGVTCMEWSETLPCESMAATRCTSVTKDKEQQQHGIGHTERSRKKPFSVLQSILIISCMCPIFPASISLLVMAVIGLIDVEASDTGRDKADGRLGFRMESEGAIDNGEEEEEEEDGAGNVGCTEQR